MSVHKILCYPHQSDRRKADELAGHRQRKLPWNDIFMSCEYRGWPWRSFHASSRGSRPVCQSLACTTSGFQPRAPPSHRQFRGDMGEKGEAEARVVRQVMAIRAPIEPALAPKQRRSINQQNRHSRIWEVAEKEMGVASPIPSIASSLAAMRGDFLSAQRRRDRRGA